MGSDSNYNNNKMPNVFNVCSCDNCDSLSCFAKRNNIESRSICSCPKCDNPNTHLLNSKATTNIGKTKSKIVHVKTEYFNENDENISREQFKKKISYDTGSLQIKSNRSENTISIQENVKKQDPSTEIRRVVVSYPTKDRSSTTAHLGAEIMNVPYSEFKNLLPLQQIKESGMTMQDIFKRIRDIYEACSCIICECLPTKLSANKNTCNCKPCQCNECALINTNSLKKLKYLSEFSDLALNDFIYKSCNLKSDKGSFSNAVNEKYSCNCKPCDCIQCKQSLEQKCDCKPCECIECKSRVATKQRTFIVAPMEGVSSGNCQCSDCLCLECNYGSRIPNNINTHEMSTETDRTTNCSCENCMISSCVDGNNPCRCETQSMFMRKPVQYDSNEYDIRNAIITPGYPNSKKQKHYSSSDTIAYYASISKTPHSFKPATTCKCKFCECITCASNAQENLRSLIDQDLIKTSSPTACECSSCKCVIGKNSKINPFFGKTVNKCDVYKDVDYMNLISTDISNVSLPHSNIQKQKVMREIYDSIIPNSTQEDIISFKNENITKQNKNMTNLHHVNRVYNAHENFRKVRYVSEQDQVRNDLGGKFSRILTDRECYKDSYASSTGRCASKEEYLMVTPTENQDIDKNDTFFANYTQNKSNVPQNFLMDEMSEYDLRNNVKYDAVKIIDVGKLSSEKVKMHKCVTLSEPLTKLHAKINDLTENDSVHSIIKVKRLEETNKSFYTKLKDCKDMLELKSNYKLVQTTVKEVTDFSLELMKMLEKYDKANKEFDENLKKIKNAQVVQIHEEETKKQFPCSILVNNEPLCKNCVPEKELCPISIKPNTVGLSKTNNVPNKTVDVVYDILDKSAALSSNVNNCDNTDTQENVLSPISMKLPEIVPNKNSDVCKKTADVVDSNNFNKSATLTKSDVSSSDYTEKKDLSPISVKATKIMQSNNDVLSEKFTNSETSTTSDIQKIDVSQVITPFPKTCDNISSKKENSERALQNNMKKEVSGLDLENDSFLSAFSNASHLSDLRKSNIMFEKISVIIKKLDAELKNCSRIDKHKLLKDIKERPLPESKRNNQDTQVETKKAEEDKTKLLPVFKKNFGIVEHTDIRRNQSVTPTLELDIKRQIQDISHQLKNVFKTSTFFGGDSELQNGNRESLNAPTMKPLCHVKDRLHVKTPKSKLGLELQDIYLAESSQTSKIDVMVDDKETYCTVPKPSYVEKRDKCTWKVTDKLKNNLSRYSCEELKPSFLAVRRVSDNTVLLQWNTPKNIEDIEGFEILIDGHPVSTVFAPHRRMAVINCLPNNNIILITIRSVTARVTNIGHFPSITIAYEPRTRYYRNELENA